LTKEELLHLYNFQIPKNGTKVKLMDMNGKKYEKVVEDAGRRTFICFALSSGIPPQVVMKWTGHSDYQAVKPYFEIAEKTKVDAMKLFDEEMKK